MTQTTMFNLCNVDKSQALARHSDPHTSKEAAEKVESSGRAGSDRAKLLEAVTRFPGYTAVELVTLIQVCSDVTRHNASRRLAELRHAGLVRNGPARLCSVSGTKQMTWTL